LRRQQDLVQTRALSVRKIGITDLDCGPKILPDVILESRVPYHRITEIALGRNSNRRSRALRSRRAKIVLHRDLDAERRLNVEITAAFAERQGRLRDHHIVRDAAAVSAWNGHLEEAGDNVVSVFFVCRDKPILGKESWPIAWGGLRSPRPGSRYRRRRTKS